MVYSRRTHWVRRLFRYSKAKKRSRKWLRKVKCYAATTNRSALARIGLCPTSGRNSGAGVNRLNQGAL